MTDTRMPTTSHYSYGVPPNDPPPPPPSSTPWSMPGFVPPPPPPPLSMPPPVPGTGLGSRREFVAPTHAPAPLVGASSTNLEKSLTVAYLLWFFLGWIGIHHFYLGKFGRGVGYLLTFAWFTIGWWVDLFTLPAQVKRVNFEFRMGASMNLAGRREARVDR